MEGVGEHTWWLCKARCRPSRLAAESRDGDAVRGRRGGEGCGGGGASHRWLRTPLDRARVLLVGSGGAWSTLSPV
jgi:hypothetical protein